MSLKELEKALVGEKAWFLKGEVRARERAHDSLLEADNIEVPIAPRAAAPAETDALEEDGDVEAEISKIVHLRVAKNLFDDRSAQPAQQNRAAAEAPEDFDVVLETGVPKESLVESYAKTYHITRTAAAVDVQALEKETAELWSAVRAKLDSFVTI